MTKKIKRVLIANRGEIAIRIIRACRDEGYEAIAIASEADKFGKHARLADEVFVMAGSTLAETYLNQDEIIRIAKLANVDAVHPGYGFLSENSLFAENVVNQGLIWIGPSANVISLLGDKEQARGIAKKVGAPLLPGFSGDNGITGEEAQDFVAKHGLPVIVKAKNGGGGRGIRIVNKQEDLLSMLDSAQREADLAFGNSDCFIERYVPKARHIETQCITDNFGNVLVLSTRECTLQRRYQKIVEEAPAPFLSEKQIEIITKASKDIMKSVGYVNAGTCEFILTPDGDFSFLEVNTRIQVEHSITEEITGIDIVRLMFKIAEGESIENLSYSINGHAIEFRVNVEDPWNNFQPTPGLIKKMRLPGGPGVRLDIGYDAQDSVPMFYDSLLGKIIIWGETRNQAIERSRRALLEFAILGLNTTIPLQRVLLERPEFCTNDSNDYDVYTTWIDKTLDQFELDSQKLTKNNSEFSSQDSSNDASDSNDDEYLPEYRVAIQSPLSGKVLEWLVEMGDIVSPGDDVAVMESMKMEQTITSEVTGTVVYVGCDLGGFINSDDDLLGLN